MYVLTRTNWSKLCTRYFILDGSELDWTQDQIGSNWVGSLQVYMYVPQNRRQIKGEVVRLFVTTVSKYSDWCSNLMTSNKDSQQ